MRGRGGELGKGVLCRGFTANFFLSCPLKNDLLVGKAQGASRVVDIANGRTYTLHTEPIRAYVRLSGAKLAEVFGQEDSDTDAVSKSNGCSIALGNLVELC